MELADGVQELMQEIADRRGLDLSVLPAPAPATEWHPTQDDIRAHIKAMGWPTFRDIRADGLTDKERSILTKAVKAVRSFTQVHKEQPGAGLIIIAGPTGNDPKRTGFGCGKTMLARIIYYATAAPLYSPELPDSLRVVPQGRFLEAREAMALFDAGDQFEARHAFAGFRELVIIDDVGREGTLQWEKRDPELQAAETQNRYYNIIDHCYQRDVSLVITSNLTAKQLAGRIGGAAWSRLLQMCPPQFRVNMTGLPDMRPLLGEQQADNWGF